MLSNLNDSQGFSILALRTEKIDPGGEAVPDPVAAIGSWPAPILRSTLHAPFPLLRLPEGVQTRGQGENGTC